MNRALSLVLIAVGSCLLVMAYSLLIILVIP